MGFLICHHCKRKLTGSFSQGSTKKYPYYHCRGRCKTRINADLLNERYVEKLQQLTLSSRATDLFNRVLQDWNISTQKRQYLCERQQIIRRLNEQELTHSQARKLFVSAILKIDDYNELKKECLVNFKELKRELRNISIKLKNIDEQCQLGDRSISNILQGFPEMDIADKKHLINLIPPIRVDFQTGYTSLDLNKALTKILLK